MVGTYELGLFFCCCRAIAYRLENGLVNQIRICYLSIHLNLEARTLPVNKQRTQPLGNYWSTPIPTLRRFDCESSFGKSWESRDSAVHVYMKWNSQKMFWQPGKSAQLSREAVGSAGPIQQIAGHTIEVVSTTVLSSFKLFSALKYKSHKSVWMFHISVQCEPQARRVE